MELKLDRLTKQFGSAIAVDRLSATLTPGVYGLLGANGAGKTTLMRMICDVLKPTSGSVVWNGVPIERLGERYRSVLGYLPQDFGYYPDFTALDFMLYLSALKGLDSKAAKRRSMELLDLVGLAGVAKRKVKTFSGGMKQRLGIAMALLGSPKLLILDEPTNGLDPAGIQEMRSLIASMPQTTGATVLISSHLLGEIEQMVDQVGILSHGKLLFEGSLQQLQKHSRGGTLLRVLTVPKALAVLQQQGVTAARLTDQPDTLQLPPLRDEALAALIRTLAESGAGVIGLTAQTKSLEDIFLSLTQSSGEVA